MKALLHWWRRPARLPRSVRGAAAAIIGAAAIAGLAAPASPQAAGSVQPNPAAAEGGAPNTSSLAPEKAPFPPGAGNPVKHFPDSAAMISEGRALYANGCSSCHGLALQGVAGAGPSLIGVGAGPVDFYLSTGRMPLDNPRDEPMREKPAYSRHQINSLIDFVASFGGPPAPTADPAKGNLALGFHLFTEHCAGCHQSVARGGLTIGAVVPNLEQATAEQVAEAVRMGPYLMPHFDAKQIDQHGLDSIAAYVLWTRHPQDSGGWGIYNLGPIPEGVVAWFLALLALVIVARLIGERSV